MILNLIKYSKFSIYKIQKVNYHGGSIRVYLKKSTKKKAKKSADSVDDSGIVLIDDDLEIDTEKELEERKAFLEEARSQDTAD